MRPQNGGLMKICGQKIATLLLSFSSIFHFTRPLLKQFFNRIVYVYFGVKKNRTRRVPFTTFFMYRPVHHISFTSCCHPLPPFFLLGRLLNSIFKSIIHTSELRYDTAFLSILIPQLQTSITCQFH